jgi:hypothetical protein
MKNMKNLNLRDLRGEKKRRKVWLKKWKVYLTMGEKRRKKW